MTAAASIFHSLKGTWKLNKEIFHAPDPRMREKAHSWKFVGSSCFALIATTELHYHEAGRMNCESLPQIVPLEAWQEYRFVLKGNNFRIHFVKGGERGELFLNLDFDDPPSSGPHTMSSEHVCGNDIYKGAFQFDLPSRFQIEFAVNGPRKNYVSKSKYFRI